MPDPGPGDHGRAGGDSVTPAEIPLFISCGDDRLFGICVVPDRPSPTGVVVVVGGPQYRVGAHRQFALLARHLGGRGIASLRFDQRGMGDSSGAPRGFEGIEEDIRAAVDALMDAVPGIRRIVLWGLCDGASAAVFYGFQDSRVAGLVLANPWVRTEGGEARAYLKTYYLRRLIDRGFWQKLIRGELRVRESAASLLNHLRAARGAPETGGLAEIRADVPARFLEAMRRFGGSVLFILSGRDFVAEEFRGLIRSGTLVAPHGGISWHELADADHTFSKAAWRDEVAATTVAWIRGLPGANETCAGGCQDRA